MTTPTRKRRGAETQRTASADRLDGLQPAAADAWMTFAEREALHLRVECGITGGSDVAL